MISNGSVVEEIQNLKVNIGFIRESGKLEMLPDQSPLNIKQLFD